MAQITVNGIEWEEKPDYKVIDSGQDFAEALYHLGNKKLIAFDYETTSLDYQDGEIWGLGVCADPNTAFYFPRPYCFQATEWLANKFEDPEVWVLAHNFKFDWHFMNWHLERFVEIKNPIDVMVMAWLIDENLALGLKPLSEFWLGETDLKDFKDHQREAKVRLKKKKLSDVHISEFDQEALAEYGAKDALLTLRLYLYLNPKLFNAGMGNIMYQDQIPFTRVLTRMEETGLWVDLDKMYALREELIGKHEELRAEWDELTDGINPNSNQQLQKFFYEDLGCKVTRRTKSGAPSTDSLSIQRLTFLEVSGNYAKILSEYRKVEKLLGTYVHKIIAKAESFGGYLRASFGQTGTVTGRLNSSNPNLQNIPLRTELGRRIREALGAPTGFVYLGIDYSQIELRIICHYSGSPVLLDLFMTGGDPHQMTADLVGVERYIGKTINFAWAYGSGARTLCDTIEKDGYERPKESDAREWLDLFSSSYPELAALKVAIIAAVARRGYVKTILGRKRRLPDISHFDRSKSGRAERQAVNAVIQGSVGDLMLHIMVRAEKRLLEMGAKFCIQVHDEIGILVPKERVEEAAAYVKEVMESVEQTFKLKVPILAEPKWDKYWGYAK
jgi:DNA polymerase-1